ncbi:MAG TPA: CpsB/CapC family capsule biosynthesis tyrosine phosphatase [Solirubrobacteraceae bacterium]
MSGPVIDLHSHVLPGIDDGPPSIEGSVELARAVAQGGTQTLLATPHVSWRYPNTSATIAPLVEQVNAQLVAEGIALQVLPGAEIAMTRAAELDPAELSRLTLGGGEWLLIECPFTPVATGMDALVLDLQRRGHRVVLAHPERCPAFHRDRRPLEMLVHGGVLTSITAGSLVGRFGGEVQRFAMQLVREDLVHNVASDTHDTERRAPGMAAEIEQAGLGELSEWLTCEVPRAILDGRSIPPRPELTVPLKRASRWRSPFR